MPASPYCPNVVQKGVVVIPQGHPLYAFIGTKYQSTLEEYLGITALYSTETCTLHSSGGSSGAAAVPSRLLDDARAMIREAETRLTAMDPASDQYRSVVSAASFLQSLLDNPSATQSDITSALTALTRALAGLN